MFYIDKRKENLITYILFYYICTTNAQYINNISFFKHSYVFLCFYIILSEFLIMYAEGTKLIKENIYTSNCYRELMD